ncbi:MAG: hypothetical protein LUC41_08680, partial [Clostridiales bacterium]|nr:hypothetical protein [Clostridiales bacterium]
HEEAGTDVSFEDRISAGDICVSESFLEEAGEGEFCFVENVPTAGYVDKIEGIWLYRWNRNYPGDFFFDIDVSKTCWRLDETRDFPGYSHEKISLEVYSHGEQI